jgi:hypothetical protein
MKRGYLGILTVALLSAAPRSSAASGDADGEVGLDFLRAGTSQSPPVGGQPESLVAQEAGIRLRFRARELDRRLSLEVDYRGREPIGGDVQTSTLRLLYAAELRFRLIERALTIGAGRFVAPSVMFLPVDAGRAEVSIDRVTIAAFGGRRAITTSLRNVDLGEFLPSAGVSASYDDPMVFAEAAYAYSRDRALLPVGGASLENELTYHSSSIYARARARLLDELSAGGQIAFAQRASYVLGPTWTDISLSLQAVGFWNGVFYVDFRPLKELRFNYDLQSQRAEIDRTGLLAGAPSDTGMRSLIPAFVDPRFTDNQLRAAYRFLDVGWVRAMFRWRLRSDRHELRYGGSLDLDRIGVPGLLARGFVLRENVTLDNPGPDLDRTLWSASAGYKNFGLDVEAGVSFIERRAGPLSSRAASIRDPADPSRPVDLSPFVLEAQRIAFVRAFYGSGAWFTGLDAEQNLADSKEQRFFIQLGALVEGDW